MDRQRQYRPLRQLASAALCAALVGLCGCGDLENVFGNPQDRALAKADGIKVQPFNIGPASRWQEPGLYLDFADTHDVALVSDHGMLVALLLINPDTGSRVRYDPISNLFKDPHDGSMYSRDGLLWGDSEGEFSLPRCRVRHLGSLDDPHVELQIDPGKRFYFEEKQWSKAASNHLFVEEE
ncbi:MAG: hypothetical protein AAGC44_01705 [Planctomycetota bacterium]